MGPSEFEPSCEFRTCPACSTINLVKDKVLSCAACDADLPEAYNCQPLDQSNSS
jgi:hypothetical protein